MLRLMVGAVFPPRLSHLKDPEGGARASEEQKLHDLLGAAEVAGAWRDFGVLRKLAATGLILLMLGASQKKIFVWKTGFWGSTYDAGTMI